MVVFQLVPLCFRHVLLWRQIFLLTDMTLCLPALAEFIQEIPHNPACLHCLLSHVIFPPQSTLNEHVPKALRK